MDDFSAAIERIVAGLEQRNRLLNSQERTVVAHHEMGHAIVAAAIPGATRSTRSGIIARAIGALGYTIQRPTEDRFLMTTRSSGRRWRCCSAAARPSTWSSATCRRRR